MAAAEAAPDARRSSREARRGPSPSYAGRIVVERVHILLAGYARLFRTSPVKGGFAGSNVCRLTGREISGRFLGDCVAVDSKIRQGW
jgi:hypothetical protein